MSYWMLSRYTRNGFITHSFDVNKHGIFRLYYAIPDGDRVVEIRVMKPRKGRHRNKTTQKRITIIDDVVSYKP